jgi:hypothetical protein
VEVSGQKEHEVRRVALSVDIDAAVLKLEYVSPSKLKANPLNWRQHPRRQRQAFSAFKDKVGWAGAVLVNRKTGNLLDGHMRVDEAIKNGETEVPVLYGDWDEDQEKLILANLDPIGSLASTNQEALQSLLEANTKKMADLSKEANRKLTQLAQDLKELPGTGPLIKQSKSVRKPVESPTEASQEREEVFAQEDAGYTPPRGKTNVRLDILNEDVFFPSSDYQVKIPLQLPELLEDMFATADMAPTDTYTGLGDQQTGPNTYYCVGSGPWPEECVGGVLGFFTEDYRFNDAYSSAAEFLEQLLETDWDCVVGPDFSTYGDWPMGIVLHNLYKNRWCSRYWQEAGIKVIPSIQYITPGQLDMTLEVSVMSLPRNVPVVALQIRSVDDYQGIASLVGEIASWCNCEKVVLYGGWEKQKYLHGYMPDTTEVVYLPSFMAKKRKQLKGK